MASLDKLASKLAPRALAEMEALVAISSPWGDVEAAERAFAVCREALPPGVVLERVPCSSQECAPDLIARLEGTGSGRLMLLGHVDTVIAHDAHQPARRDGERIWGSGTADMKGGVAVSLALFRELALEPGDFAELALLLVCDEEWRTAPFAHVERFAGYDACLCFEAGERAQGGEEGVIVRRKGAGMLKVKATGRAAHSGSAPQDGRNALLALAHVAISLSELADPGGPDRLTVVPTIAVAGTGLNIVPGYGELVLDMRSDDTDAFRRVIEAVPAEIDEVGLSASLERVWPAMDSGDAAAGVIAAASGLLGRAIVPRTRGGASDASHFAPSIPVTLCGLGPRGGGAHTPQEFTHVASMAERIAVSLAVAQAVLSGRQVA